jgi:hypothetical protein
MPTKTTNKDAWEANPLKDEPLMRFFRELNKVKDDHRSLILITNGFLELLIETLIKTNCKNAKRITEDRRSYPYSAKLLLLNESGVLADETYRAFDWFRRLRNRAAHEPFFSIMPADLQRVKDDNLRRPEKFYTLCVHMIGAFWNAHIAVLGPVFAPGVVAPRSSPDDAAEPPSHAEQATPPKPIRSRKDPGKRARRGRGGQK